MRPRLNTVVARTRLFNLHPRVAINLHCIPTAVVEMQPRLRNRWLFLKKSVAEDGEGAFPLWQFCWRLGRWEVVQGLSAVLHSVPETVTDRWRVVSSLCQPNPVLDNGRRWSC